jgi:hypothetical protein
MASRIDRIPRDEGSISSDAANRAAIAAAAATEPLLVPMDLTVREIGLLIDFLHALTDPASVDLRHTVPARVPSGLPLAD